MIENQLANGCPGYSRRKILGSGLAAGGLLAFGTADLFATGKNHSPDDVKPAVRNGVAWYNVQKWGIEGKGWKETESYFDRLPALKRI